MKQLELLRKLTDVFAKNPNSYMGKFYLIVSEQLTKLTNEAEKVENWRDVDQAEGTTLDAIGASRGQQRGRASDEVMRALIKTKIAQNNSDGTIEMLIEFLSLALKIPKSQVIITSLWTEGTHATIHVNVPAAAINKTGLSLAQFGQLINVIVASGIRAEVLFEGTFAFSDDYNESQFDNNTGFADDAQTIGGTMGYVYDPSEDVELPI